MQITLDFYDFDVVKSSNILDNNLLDNFLYCTFAIFKSGYSEYRYYNKPKIDLWNDLTCYHGSIVNFKIVKLP